MPSDTPPPIELTPETEGLTCDGSGFISLDGGRIGACDGCARCGAGPAPDAQVINFSAPTEGAAAAAPAGAADQLPPQEALRRAAQRLVRRAQALALNPNLSLVGTKYLDEVRAALAAQEADEPPASSP